MNLTLDSAPFLNLIGFLALLFYSATLMGSILKINFPETQKTGIPQKLMKHRRLIGLLTFFLSAIHGYPYFKQRDIDLFAPETSWVYIQGVVSFLILLLLAITSNNWSRKLLKKNWKKLHQLTYLVIFLLIWHVWEKMSGHWTYLTPIGLVAITGTAGLLIKRMQIEHENK